MTRGRCPGGTPRNGPLTRPSQVVSFAPRRPRLTYAGPVSPQTSRRSRLSAALVAVALAAGCSADAKPPAAQPSLSPSPTATPSPTVKPTPPQLRSPFTGRPVDALKPVVAIKVDNAALARPQWGLDLADIVYEEAVEGRTTRFIAVYSSEVAKQVGPVRSVRESDLELLSMFGKVAFGFSGGNRGVLAGVRRSGAVYEVSYNNIGSAYTVAGRRRDAYNYVTGTDRILAHAPKAAVAKDIGFRFGSARPGGTSGKQLSFVWSQYARTTWKYDAKTKKYLRFMDGRPAMLRNGKQQSAPTVVLQYTRVRGSRYSDTSGAMSPYTVTTGTGKVVVLRDGKAYAGTWKRSGTGPTRFLDAKGRDITLKTGPVWVMLAPNDLRAAIS